MKYGNIPCKCSQQFYLRAALMRLNALGVIVSIVL